MTPLEQEQMKNLLIIAAAAGAGVGATISAIMFLVNGWRQRIADSRRHQIDTEAANLRHLRELAIKAAISNWESECADARRILDDPRTPPGTEVPVRPLDLYLVHAALLVETLDGSITEANIAERLGRIQRTYLAGAAQVDRYSTTLTGRQ